MDPLTLRELIGVSRRSQIYLSRVLYVGLIGLAVYLWWYWEGGRFRILSRSQVAGLGRSLFTSLVIGQMVLVGLGAMIGGADLLLKEIRGRTLGIVVATPLSGIAIVWGKWKAAMIQAVALVLCGLPAIAICAYLGGIGPWEMAWCVCLTVSQASVCTALGLRHAMTSRTASGATFMAAMEYLAPVILCTLLSRLVPPLTVVLFLHPIGALEGVTNSRLVGTPAEFGWVFATVTSLVVSLWVIVRTGRRVVDFWSRVEEPNPDLTEDRGLLVAGAAIRSWVTETRVWDDEALLWKELATRPGARLESYLGKPLLWCTLGLFAGMWLGTDGSSVEFLALVEGVVLAAVVLIGSGLFTRDRETRWNEIILCTPLSSVQLLRAKLIGGLLAPESLYVLAVGLSVHLAWTLPSGIIPALIGLATTTLFLLFAYLLAALSSLLGTTIRGSFLWAGGTLAVLLIAFPHQSVWNEWKVLFGRGPEWRFEDFLSSLNPLIFLHSDRHSGLPFLQVDKPLQALLAFLGTYLAAAMALLVAIGGTFQRRRSRG